jgi:hypothetical protein
VGQSQTRDFFVGTHQNFKIHKEILALRLDELCSVGTHQHFKNLDSYNGGTDSPKISENIDELLSILYILIYMCCNKVKELLFLFFVLA